MNFTVEETNLMCIYGAENRAELIAILTEMQGQLQEDETELLALTESTIAKLTEMSDETLETVKDELLADF